MEKAAFLIAALPLLLCCLLFAAWEKEAAEQEEETLYASVECLAEWENMEMRIEGWTDYQNAKIYIFVPGFLKEIPMKFVVNTVRGTEAYLDDKRMDALSVTEVESGRNYKLTFKNKRNQAVQKQFQVEMVCIEKLPTMFFTLQNGNLEYLQENKENTAEGQLAVITDDGRAQYQGK